MKNDKGSMTPVAWLWLFVATMLAMAARSSREKVRAYPAKAMVASKSAPGVTVWAGSNGFVLPLMELKMSGTAFASDRVFQ